MKKQKKSRPDYQVSLGNGKFKDGGGMALCTSDYFKPVRLLTIPDRGLVCLMASISGDQWIIYCLDKNNIPWRSKIYPSRSDGESTWRALCNELTAEARRDFTRMENDPDVNPATRAYAGMEVSRLEFADDELFEEWGKKFDEAIKRFGLERVRAVVAKIAAAAN